MCQFSSDWEHFYLNQKQNQHWVIFINAENDWLAETRQLFNSCIYSQLLIIYGDGIEMMVIVILEQFVFPFV